ncbi:hypothetical protein NKH77_43370 [Streptomyces sp. M19]
MRDVARAIPAGVVPAEIVPAEIRRGRPRRDHDRRRVRRGLRAGRCAPGPARSPWALLPLSPA